MSDKAVFRVFCAALIAVLIALLPSTVVYAQQVCDPDNLNKQQSFVLHTNGIKNSRLDAQLGIVSIAEGWGDLGLGNGESRCFGYVYNPSESLLGDVVEAAIVEERATIPVLSSQDLDGIIEQKNEALRKLADGSGEECLFSAMEPAECSKTVMQRRTELASLLDNTREVEEVTNELKNRARTRLGSGARVLFTGHSEGTLFSYSSYSALRMESGSLYSEALGAILVASPLQGDSSCLDDDRCRHYTGQNDQVISFAESVLDYEALPESVVVNMDDSSFSGHAFVEAYFRQGLQSRAELDTVFEGLLVPVSSGGDPLLRYPVPAFRKSTALTQVLSPEDGRLTVATEVMSFQNSANLIPSLSSIVIAPENLFTVAPGVEWVGGNIEIAVGTPTMDLLSGTWSADVLLQEENISPTVVVGSVELQVCDFTPEFWRNVQSRSDIPNGLICDVTSTAENTDRVLIAPGVPTPFSLILGEERSTDTTVLHMAAGYSSDSLIISALVDAGADVAAQNSPHGNTPLHLAALYSDTPEAIMALGAAATRAGVDVEQMYDRFGQTPLHLAAFANRPADIINALIAAGIDKDIGDGDTGNTGDTPLILAAQGHSLTALQALIAAGADVNAMDDFMGETPLHTAMFFDAPIAIPRALVNAGADVGAEVTYFDFSVGSTVTATALNLAAAFVTDPEVIQVLADAGADVGATNDFGGTALHVAAFADRPADIINALIAAGISVEVGDVLGTPENMLSGDTPGDPPLTIAALWHSLTALRALIAAGANVNAVDDSAGRTPLHAAGYFGAPATIINALLDAGAIVNALGTQGFTPLDWAQLGATTDGIDTTAAQAALRALGGQCNDPNPGGFGLYDC